MPAVHEFRPDRRSGRLRQPRSAVHPLDQPQSGLGVACHRRPHCAGALARLGIARRGLRHGTHDQGLSRLAAAGDRGGALRRASRALRELLKAGRWRCWSRRWSVCRGHWRSISASRTSGSSSSGTSTSAVSPAMMRSTRGRCGSSAVAVCRQLPWTLLVVPALKRTWAKRRERHTGFLALWFALPFLFFSLSSGKLPTYIMPCFFPLALLMANTLVDKLRQQDLRLLRGNGLLNLALGGLSLLGLIGLELTHSVFSGHPVRLASAALVCLVWALCGAVQWKRANQALGRAGPGDLGYRSWCCRHPCLAADHRR